MAYAFSVPIPPGKTGAVRRFFAESLGPCKADYDDLQRRRGVTGEAYWLQPDPEHGDVLVIVSECKAGDDRAFQAIMANPQTEFDRWYRARLLDIMGIDVGEPGGSPNELLGRWQP